MMKTLRFVLAGLLVPWLCPAQVAPDSWVVTAFTSFGNQGGVWIVDPTRTALVQPQPQTPEMLTADPVAVDATGRVWFASYSGPSRNHVFVVAIQGTAVTQQVQLTAAPLPAGGTATISALALHGGRLWFCSSDGMVGSLDPTAAGQTPVLAPPVPLQQWQSANALTSDGREVFVALWESIYGSGPTVWALDPSAASPAWRPVADTRNGGTAGASAAALGPDGDILVADFDGVVRRVDPRSGTVLAASPAGALQNAGGYDPWTGLFGVAEPNWQLQFCDLGSATWLPGQLAISGPTVGGMAAVAEPPFLRFGHGCAGAQAEPRMAWSGLPVAGGTASVSLLDGAPGGLALLLFGFSNTTSVLGPLPLAGGPFGAPGCDLLVSPDAVAGFATANGTASHALALPNGPIVHGLVLHTQWLVSSPVNALGFVASEGLTIRMR